MRAGLTHRGTLLSATLLPFCLSGELLEQDPSSPSALFHGLASTTSSLKHFKKSLSFFSPKGPPFFLWLGEINILMIND